MDGLKFENLCGKHIFYGCELCIEEFEDEWIGKNVRSVCLFNLDGITYKATENPDDGYRSYCDALEVSDKLPKYFIPGGNLVMCSMKENEDWAENDVLVIKDFKNGKEILRVGTAYVNDWYPCCVFEYNPENMSCNEKK